MKRFALTLVLLLIPSIVFSANWDFPYEYPVGSNLQIRADYDARTDSQPVYLCYARRGAASSDTEWMCAKYTYDGSDQMTVKQIAINVSYDNRTSATYQ